MNNTDTVIKEGVREHYAKAIKKAGGCCGPSSAAGECCTPKGEGAAFYNSAEIASLDGDYTSFGCGNPLAIASLKGGERVLDLGSGAGLDVMLAARAVGEAGRVYGLDMTDEMLETAQRNVAKSGLRNIVLLKGDIESVPLPGSSVDVIISNCVVNLAPSKEKVLAEAFRVLVPGGRFTISDIIIDGSLGGFGVDREALRAKLDWAGCIAGALERADLEKMLAAAGFEDVGITITHRYSVADVGPRPAEFSAISDETYAKLASMFVSASIIARKPASSR